jgi:hypothetical protein
MIKLFNFGEPFLDKRLLEILKLAKRIVPDAFVLISTNGTVIPDGWPAIIVKEGLIGCIIFSIDGASQETYCKYRIGGNFNKAFNNMAEFSKYKRIYVKTMPDLTWQYILFKWNDSDIEIERARELAAEHGLTINWLYTHTNGNSQRCLPKSEEYKELQELVTYSCGIIVPGHGNRSMRSHKIGIQGTISKMKYYGMTFFRLGGGLGDDVANNLFTGAAIILASILFLPIQLLTKFSIVTICLLVIIIYRQKERIRLEDEFKAILIKRPKNLKEYIYIYLDIYYSNHELEAFQVLDINSIINGRFKKFLCYETHPNDYYSLSDMRRYLNIINKIFFLSCPIPDSIINAEIRLSELSLYFHKRFKKKYAHYELIRMFAKEYGREFNETDITLLEQALAELGYNIDRPLLSRMIRENILNS